jgi:hypothetical protein
MVGRTFHHPTWSSDGDQAYLKGKTKFFLFTLHVKEED